MRHFAVILVLLVLTACGDDSIELEWGVRGQNVTDQDLKDVGKAVNTLRRVCPSLFDHTDDIVEATATVWQAVGYRADLYGWDREVTLTPRLSENAQLPVEWYAGGHTLYYHIGIGGRAGVVMSKDVSMLICGQPGQSSDLFVAAKD